jgi:UPF0755 protein
MHVALRKSRRIQIAAALAVLIFVASLSALREARKPDPIPNYLASERASETTIVIPPGATGDQIARILFDAGVVKSARSFFAAATSNPKSQSIQPGTYKINRKIPGAEAVSQLLERDRRLFVLLIKEGERTYEIANNLLKFDFDREDIDALNQEEINIPGFGVRNPEGFFYPATYNLIPGEELGAVRSRLLNKFQNVVNEIDFVSRAKGLGLTPYQALIIASITQSEGFNESDFKRVARVIYNRLELGMPLQMDSTVLYALKERRIAVTNRDINIASAFNTYNRRGLPPTPISNPGKAALEATVNPDSGDWLYFVTVEPGVTKFTDSYKEFLTFKREFQRNLRAGKFGSES